MPRNAPLKSEAEHRYIGKPTIHVDAADIAQGKGTFGADYRLPNMATAVIVRCPWLGGGVKKIANKPAGVPGLIGIEILDPAPSAGPVFSPLGGAAVVAEDTWTAIRIARELDIEWTTSPNQAFASDDLRGSLREALTRPGGLVPGSDKGDIDEAFEAGGNVLEASYETPFLAHAPMEPPVAVAEVADGRCVVHAPVQDPQSARGLIAGHLGIGLDKVSVTPTLLGGAFGRKSKPDFAVEAVELSKRLKRPVRVQWLREDDIRHDYFHAASAQYHRAIIDEAGRPSAWLQRTAFPSITSVFAAQASQPAAWELEMGFSNLPYQVDHQRMEFTGIRPGVRIGWLRSVLQHLPRLLGQRIRRRDGHGRRARSHRASARHPRRRRQAETPGPAARCRDTSSTSAACAMSLNGYATCPTGQSPVPKAWGLASRSTTASTPTLPRSWRPASKTVGPRVSNAYVVLDCGTYVNPDTCRAQMEGAVVFGLSLALYGDIAMKEGAVVQSNFHDYPMLRMPEVPFTTVELVPSQGRPPAGVGEPGVPPVAPALSNAIFAATGTRHRKLPIRT